MTNDSKEKYLSTVPALWILPAIMLLIAVLPLPYGYYTLLRIVVCIAASFIAYSVRSESENVGLWAVVFAVIALIFNPIIPIHLPRETWLIINLICAGTFCAFGIIYQRKNLLK